MSSLDQLLEFVKEVEKFKTIERNHHTSNQNRIESNAEHSWHLALLILLFEDDLKDLDLIKIFKLALIHDLPEIYAEDKNPYRDDLSDKPAKENNAIATMRISLFLTFMSLTSLLGESSPACFLKTLLGGMPHTQSW